MDESSFRSRFKQRVPAKARPEGSGEGDVNSPSAHLPEAWGDPETFVGADFKREVLGVPREGHKPDRIVRPPEVMVYGVSPTDPAVLRWKPLHDIPQSIAVVSCNNAIEPNYYVLETQKLPGIARHVVDSINKASDTRGLLEHGGETYRLELQYASQEKNGPIRIAVKIWDLTHEVR